MPGDWPGFILRKRILSWEPSDFSLPPKMRLSLCLNLSSRLLRSLVSSFELSILSLGLGLVRLRKGDEEPFDENLRVLSMRIRSMDFLGTVLLSILRIGEWFLEFFFLILQLPLRYSLFSILQFARKFFIKT